MYALNWLAGYVPPGTADQSVAPKPNLFENHSVFYLGSLAAFVYSQSRCAVRAKSNLHEDLVEKKKVTSVPPSLV